MKSDKDEKTKSETEMVNKTDSNFFELRPHIKYRFDNNESAWLFMYNYFHQFLLNSLLSYASMGKSPSVVFDIDFTVLRHQPPTNPFTSGTFSFLTTSIALNLYNLFRSYNIPIYFVTGRPNTSINTRVTEKELTTLGFMHYKKIYYMPKIDDDVGLYKQSVRNQLKPILFNVGDQWTDLLNAPINSDEYDAHSYILYNIETDCDWALKLIPPKPHTFQPKIFDQSERCERCGYLQRYH